MGWLGGGPFWWWAMGWLGGGPFWKLGVDWWGAGLVTASVFGIHLIFAGCLTFMRGVRFACLVGKVDDHALWVGLGCCSLVVPCGW